jgi:hypothetical protein
MKCCFRRTYAAAELPKQFPPVLRDPNKQLAFELAMAGAPPAGEITVTQWHPLELPAEVPQARPEEIVLAGYFDYPATRAAAWHVNFADPNLFVAYGSRLLAQDELQCVEHPALGSIREALVHEGLAASTETSDGPTPVLVANVERRCTLETAASMARPLGLYAHQFTRADPATLRSALTRHDPAQRSNLIAIAAPVGSGRYTRAQLERVVITAFTGFAAAVHEDGSGRGVEICTGFWGCGAFGGNREVMTALQLLAARLAGVARVKFYAVDDAGRADFLRGQAAIERALAGTTRVAEVIDRLDAAGYVWGLSNGT